MTKGLCYKKVKSKGPRPYVVFNKKGQAHDNFSNLKELREDFGKIKKC